MQVLHVNPAMQQDTQRRRRQHATAVISQSTREQLIRIIRQQVYRRHVKIVITRQPGHRQHLTIQIQDSH